ncbi:hypothetical protein [Terrisporobacter sp.]|uniref:hypothetical protein n=1 Tax=Terrisporobacter sp. TaxID=1965305 RepID=UPI002601F5E3|nr:hypothetical protein [Terrisporobacter sp.]
MEFDANVQALKCPNCGTKVDIENDPTSIVEHNLDIHAMRKIKVEEKTSTSMECEGCGAHVEVDKTSTATTCPYCGSHYVLSQKQLDSIVPDGVIPFKIDKNKVESIFTNWIKGRWLAPNILKTLYQKDKIQGIYMPYWTFDANTRTHYTAMGGINHRVEYEDENGEKKVRIETRWYPTSGNINHFFDDILVSASNKLDEILLIGVQPSSTRNIVSYSPDYMSGYCAEIYTVDLKDAHNEALAKMNRRLRSKAESDVLRRYDCVRALRLNTSYSDETYKHIFVPVYSTAYTYKDKRYNVLINGETGEIRGEYPKSIAKITAIIILILGILFGIYMSSSEDEVAYNYKSPENQYMTSVGEYEIVEEMKESYNIFTSFSDKQLF